MTCLGSYFVMIFGITVYFMILSNTKKIKTSVLQNKVGT